MQKLRTKSDSRSDPKAATRSTTWEAQDLWFSWGTLKKERVGAAERPQTRRPGRGGATASARDVLGGLKIPQLRRVFCLVSCGFCDARRSLAGSCKEFHESHGRYYRISQGLLKTSAYFVLQGCKRVVVDFTALLQGSYQNGNIMFT